MKLTRSKPVLTIFILLTALALLTTFSAAASLVTPTRSLPVRAPGNFQPGASGLPARGTGGSNPFGLIRSLGLGGQIFRYIGLGFSALEAILLGLSAYGVWRQKRAWLNLAMILSILLLLGALPGMFFAGRFFNFWNFARAVFQAGAAAVILALGILPSARDSFA